jgi:hypothetical protein
MLWCFFVDEPMFRLVGAVVSMTSLPQTWEARLALPSDGTDRRHDT